MHWFKKFLVLSRSRNILANEICQRKFGRIKGASAVDVTGIDSSEIIDSNRSESEITPLDS